MTRNVGDSDDDEEYASSSLAARRREMEEEDDAELNSYRMTWGQMCWLGVVKHNMLRFEMERWNQCMIKKDLRSQANVLRAEIAERDSRIADLQEKYDDSLPALRKVINEKTLLFTRGAPFTKKDVESVMTGAEQDELRDLERLEHKITKIKQSRKVLSTALENVSRLMMDSEGILEDMKLAKSLEEANAAMKRSKGLSMEEYRRRMVNELNEVSSQIGVLSRSQLQIAEVNDAKDDVVVSGDVRSMGAIDMLFADAMKHRATPVATRASLGVKPPPSLTRTAMAS